MEISKVHTFILVVAGLIAIVVGAGILFAPQAFHASAGIDLRDDVRLLNEMRAPGGAILVCGLFVIAGAFRARLAFPATMLAFVLYTAFGLSRLVGMAIDGLPGPALVQITILELAVGLVCGLALLRYRKLA
ncbi:MAG: DUF4345 domain-containing protein [Alphaproteobacteria bacterium]|nr:DUF4345 domain-containing protein [Alphaproteobacteria bacterium]